MDSITPWFPGVKLNFAENILFTAQPGSTSAVNTIGKEDSKIAVVEVREGGSEIRRLSWASLRQNVGRLAQAMKAQGVSKGDRVAIVASNSIDSLQTFLAVTVLGGIFSSSSADMGVKVRF
jgi:acetoacetyl-CoA synthetase